LTIADRFVGAVCRVAISVVFRFFADGLRALYKLALKAGHLHFFNDGVELCTDG
jgi:hypothetical protein